MDLRIELHRMESCPWLQSTIEATVAALTRHYACRSVRLRLSPNEERGFDCAIDVETSEGARLHADARGLWKSTAVQAACDRIEPLLFSAQRTRPADELEAA